MARPVLDARRGDLRVRVLSALLLAPIAVAAAWFGTPWFEVLVAIAIALAGAEWCRLTGVTTVGGRAVVIGLGPVMAVAALAQGAAASLLAGAVLAAAAMAAEWPRARAAALRAGAGVVYLALPAAAILWLRRDIGPEIVLWLLLVVWATDSAAYIVGRAVGGPRLAPRMSPKKTWAGLAGGVGAAAAVGAGAGGYMSAASPWLLALLGGILAGVAQLGDLFESAVKRAAGAKDAGHLIPGHGGILDRIDGMLAAAPVLALAALTWRAAGGDPWP